MVQDRASGYPCRVAGHWLGGLALADDVMLLSPSVQALHTGACCNFGRHAQDTDLVVSTDKNNPEISKTMCIFTFTAKI